jgi:predicted phosphodiesterase
MRYGIISDIHGNLEALEAVLEALMKDEIDELLCIGDIVGYGADPSECIAKIKEINPITVCGNHDAASINLLDISYFNDSAKDAIVWTSNNISVTEKEYLKKLPILYKNRYLEMVHGTLKNPEEFNYMIDIYAAKATFELMRGKVCFVGHSHIPGIFTLKGGKINYYEAPIIKISKYEKVIINVGSVGQPRDKDPRLSYVIYDTVRKTVEMKRKEYDIKKAAKKILDAGLSPSIAERLEKGI